MPKCWVKNGEEVGSTVSLWCKSSEGSTPLIYKWTKENGEALPSTAFQSKSSLLFQAKKTSNFSCSNSKIIWVFKINMLSRLIYLDFEFDRMIFCVVLDFFLSALDCFFFRVNWFNSSTYMTISCTLIISYNCGLYLQLIAYCPIKQFFPMSLHVQKFNKSHATEFFLEYFLTNYLFTLIYWFI